MACIHSHYMGGNDSQVRFRWNGTYPQLYHSAGTFCHNNKVLRKNHFYLGQNNRRPSVRELGGNDSLQHQEEDCNLYRDFIKSPHCLIVFIQYIVITPLASTGTAFGFQRLPKENEPHSMTTTFLIRCRW